MEGPTDDEEILKLRAQQRRNFLTTLLLSLGTPMIAHGDEFARTQGGNNNVYCQDNETSWMNWDRLKVGDDLHDFTKRLIAIRKNHPVFRRRRFLAGGPLGTDAQDRDVAWLTPDGRMMTQDDWDFAFGKALQAYVNGSQIAEPDSRGQQVIDDSFLLMFNAFHEDIEFTLPSKTLGAKWEVLIDTTEPLGHPAETEEIEAGGTKNVPARSTIVLRQIEPPIFDENNENEENNENNEDDKKAEGIEEAQGADD